MTGEMQDFSPNVPGLSRIIHPPRLHSRGIPDVPGSGGGGHAEAPRARESQRSNPVYQHGLQTKSSSMSTGRPSPRFWAMLRLVEGGGRWSWRLRLAVAVERAAARAV